MVKKYIFEERWRPWHWRPDDEMEINIGPDGSVEATITLSGQTEEEAYARYKEYLRRKGLSQDDVQRM